MGDVPESPSFGGTSSYHPFVSDGSPILAVLVSSAPRERSVSDRDAWGFSRSARPDLPGMFW